MIKTFIFTSVLLATACSSLANDEPGYTVIEEFSLPPELGETSGLYCPENDSLYTINDSGNEPIIYRLNLSGEIQDQLHIATKNTDWESITGDTQYFYVGDIGNNSGRREFVQIHVVDKNSPESPLKRSLQISYVNDNIEKNEYLNHDFDAEAILSMDDSLMLFSKSWKTNQLLIYKLSKTELKQTVSPITTVEGLPGVVTGIDYNRLRNEFVLVGYRLQGLGVFTPFIARMNNEFKVLSSYQLKGFNQVEGVCVSPTGDVWISQESAFFSTHKLAKLQLR